MFLCGSYDGRLWVLSWWKETSEWNLLGSGCKQKQERLIVLISQAEKHQTVVLWQSEWKVVEMESSLQLSLNNSLSIPLENKLSVQGLFWVFNKCLKLTASPERSKLPLCSIPGAAQPWDSAKHRCVSLKQSQCDLSALLNWSHSCTWVRDPSASHPGALPQLIETPFPSVTLPVLAERCVSPVGTSNKGVSREGLSSHLCWSCTKLLLHCSCALVSLWSLQLVNKLFVLWSCSIWQQRITLLWGTPRWQKENE